MPVSAPSAPRPGYVRALLIMMTTETGDSQRGLISSFAGKTLLQRNKRPLTCPPNTPIHSPTVATARIAKWLSSPDYLQNLRSLQCAWKTATAVVARLYWPISPVLRTYVNDVTFSALAVAEPILRALAAEHYTIPTPIQARAIPALLYGRDLLGIA